MKLESTIKFSLSGSRDFSCYEAVNISAQTYLGIYAKPWSGGGNAYVDIVEVARVFESITRVKKNGNHFYFIPYEIPEDLIFVGKHIYGFVEHYSAANNEILYFVTLEDLHDWLNNLTPAERPNIKVTTLKFENVAGNVALAHLKGEFNSL